MKNTQTQKTKMTMTQTQTFTKRPIIGMRKLAQHLGVHYNTVYNWKKQGFLKYKTAGKTMIFDPEDFLHSYVS